MLLWYALGLACFLAIICEYYFLKTGIPTVTSFPSVRREMIRLLKEEFVKQNTGAFTILDLGSGTGKLALEIGRAIPSARVTGVEISIVPFLFSLIRRYVWSLVWKVKNIEFKRENFWSYDISQVNAVVIYINANVCARMATKLKEGLRPGTLVVSNEVHLPGWKPLLTRDVGVLKVKVVVYRQD